MVFDGCELIGSTTRLIKGNVYKDLQNCEKKARETLDFEKFAKISGKPSLTCQALKQDLST